MERSSDCYRRPLGARRADCAQPRRFPPAWTVEELDACIIVKDSNEQALGYVYYEDERQRRTTAKMLSKDEARRIRRPPAFRGLSGAAPLLQDCRVSFLEPAQAPVKRVVFRQSVRPDRRHEGAHEEQRKVATVEPQM